MDGKKLSTKRQAAVDAYKAATGREPPKGMSIKGMQQAAVIGEVEQVRAAKKDVIARHNKGGFGVAPKAEVEAAGKAVRDRIKAAKSGPAPKAQAASAKRAEVERQFREVLGRDPTKAEAKSVKGMAGQIKGLQFQMALSDSRGRSIARMYTGSDKNALGAHGPATKTYPNIPPSSKLGQALRGPRGAEVAHAVDALRAETGKVIASRSAPEAPAAAPVRAAPPASRPSTMQRSGAAVLGAAARLALPAFAAFGAYQGAQADTNKVRGAVRGAIGALDPTGIVTNIGAATGVMTDHRSLGERAFDSAFGKAGSGQKQAARATTGLEAAVRHQMARGGSPKAPTDSPADKNSYVRLDGVAVTATPGQIAAWEKRKNG